MPPRRYNPKKKTLKQPNIQYKQQSKIIQYRQPNIQYRQQSNIQNSRNIEEEKVVFNEFFEETEFEKGTRYYRPDANGTQYYRPEIIEITEPETTEITDYWKNQINLNLILL
ncbi:5566_t:CDS:2 [Racocetra persica]|uniref:5566_t:CDS:1 n=1 Tax=Racocetra persica TaxID=160502 RepID=A0ACA9LIX3_9GLOM|nr:5566_t:CDS:2 [Racocetra persica]